MSKFSSGAKTSSANSSKTGSTSGRTSSYKSNTTSSSTGGKNSGYGSQSSQSKYSNTKQGQKYQNKADKQQYKSDKSDAKLHRKQNKIASKKHNLQKAFDNNLKSEMLERTPTSHRAIAGGVTAALGLAVLNNRKRAAEMDTLKKITGDWKDVENNKTNSNSTNKGDN